MTPAEKILWAHMEDVPEHKRIFDEDVFKAIISAMEEYRDIDYLDEINDDDDDDDDEIVITIKALK